MTNLSDQSERDRFTGAHGKNISVIAPAGVGKTYAIVARLVAIASQSETLALDRLPRLIVVTYSVRAAQEMQQRARAAIREAGLSSRVQRAFQQTFFGTIHSYCVRLLERFGHCLGLPYPMTLLQDQEEAWNRFLVRGIGPLPDADSHLEELFHFFPPEKLYALGREVEPGEVKVVGARPTPEIQSLVSFSLEGLHSSTKRSLATAQAAVRQWSEAWARGDRFYPLPKCPETEKAPEFVLLWIQTFAPLHEWLRTAALTFGRGLANAYAAFRISEAVMTYDDQVRLALRLLDHPSVQQELAQDRSSVLLDEAQDTDPRQFDVLLRVAGLGSGLTQAEDQSFCIVGDFQQAIYAPRSDLSVYRQVHDDLILEPRGSSSQLKVTFRCDEAIIRFVNKIFPTVLHGEGGQSAFFPLLPRHEAGSGQVVRLLCPDHPGHAAGNKINADLRARHEAQFLADQLKNLGPTALGADAWSQIAILCPRKNWLLSIARELRAAGLPVQLHSSEETQNDHPAGAWLAALVWVIAHPEDSFEIAGVLREIFGVSDHDIALFTQGEGDRLRLDRASPKSTGPVERALALLRELAAAPESEPVHHLVERILAKTHLRERLRSIGEGEPESTDNDLDESLAAVLRRSAEGVTLFELARELRLNLAQAASAPEEIHDAIQLLTSHKAKGLEWQTVILPYTFRAIESKTPAYPRLVHTQGGQEMVLRDKGDYATHARAWVQARDRQQLQRLLYVMCTRARHTLLLLDDEALFDGQMNRGGWSSGDLLNFLGGLNRIAWKALPETFTLADAPTQPRPALVAASLLDKRPLLSDQDRTLAIEQAQALPRRITPHALAQHREESEPEKRFEREEDPLSGTENPGIIYGTWWHEFIQRVPWEQPRDAWQKTFAHALLRSPQPERSTREWNLFLRSSLAIWLAQPGRLIQREFPFLWKDPTGSILEGVIDLAVYVPEESRWQVIDWKTNRVPKGKSTALVELYRGQIQAYSGALRALLSAEVKGSLYLTASGEWLPVEEKAASL